ncbi:MULTISPECIES: flagellar basal body rod protein FlgB [Brevibacillus]|jgi:flagellar basal-body rod protein FlgB|uniref:Flagellar basal body rod protein FlgB n=1 Tax=Brevibacillus centrosporus TaxID=54910 RepID=A0A1I3NQS7_9BACL|nr:MULTISPECIES: flagellar basal body rod protein FlgB [Brevibacillus]MEC2128433.1 flagellar basal body rod protein FlgB [Brevibacillus centrosporus]MED1794395.1 flagellar basal body rod protein FlgB [Brevibacillus nitrificans]MED4909856.1 flagellar basal body rod protein FlgB [Brevibacillus centrosporus]RNB73725.1 flagellar basal body rod protein FlgB [Brevibacillus centrosporus]SFJ11086.1 flagellar basal-body rod protein FlgB [Brevibacillus centrosporus]
MLGSYHLQVLERSMDAANLRHRTIANNLANIDTPQFKSQQVVFENYLQQELSGTLGGQNLEAYRTSSKHIPFANAGSFARPQIVSNPNNNVQNNGNDVDMESEQTELAKNYIWYSGLTQLTTGSLQKIRSVIDGGGK